MYRRDEGVGKWSNSKRGRRIRRSIYGNGYMKSPVNRQDKRAALRRRRKIKGLVRDALVFLGFVVVMWGVWYISK